MKEFDTIDEYKSFTSSGKMRLLYISRPACGVCTALKPKVMEIVDSYTEIEAAYLNMDKLPESAGEFSIFTIPGILFYIEGKETIREARYISIDDLSSKIDRYHQMMFN